VAAAGASRIRAGKQSASNVDASNAHGRRGPQRAKRSLPVPTPRAAPRRDRYRIEAGIVGRLREERRAMIQAAPIEPVERDGRVFELRRLDVVVGELRTPPLNRGRT
jgi:hypothetical protein